MEVLEAFDHTWRARRTASTLVLMLMLGMIPVTGSRSSAQTSTPTLEPAGIIRTTPFRNTEISMKDGEGSAYVPKDRSLWLADDNSDSIFEVNPRTGELKRVIGGKVFRSTERFGGSARAGRARSGDIEGLAYDEAKDVLYVFSGPCCQKDRPTVFRLTRDRRDGLLRPDSWQPLEPGTNFAAAGWNPADGRVYVGDGPDLQTYAYKSNAIGEAFRIPGLPGITGMGFSKDGSQMYVVTHNEELHAVDWVTKTIVTGWSFDLTPFKVLDSRGVDRIGGRFYVLDGETRPGNARLEFAVFKFDVGR